jgi:hypothetical protein
VVMLKRIKISKNPVRIRYDNFILTEIRAAYV